MLHVPETRVPRARFPVVDFHTHITSARASSGEPVLRFNLKPDECLAVMDRKNLRTMVSLTGGYGAALREAVAKLQNAYSGRFVVFTEPAWSRASESGYAQIQGDLIEDGHKAGARRNVMRRHPRTQFVCLYVANAENLPYVSECMDSHRNMHVDIAARIGELGRQPRQTRKFIEKYQDRIVFGTDASPATSGTPQQIFCDELYEIYFRFLETEDEYFDYSPAHIPPQGRWRISGLGLPDSILRKVYNQNALRLIGIAG